MAVDTLLTILLFLTFPSTIFLGFLFLGIRRERLRLDRTRRQFIMEMTKFRRHR